MIMWITRNKVKEFAGHIREDQKEKTTFTENLQKFKKTNTII